MWQPMKTAPRDGTRVLVDFGRVGVHAVAWTESQSGDWKTWCVDDRKHGPYALRGWVDADVRGWQPLPAGGISEAVTESCGCVFCDLALQPEATFGGAPMHAIVGKAVFVACTKNPVKP